MRIRRLITGLLCLVVVGCAGWSCTGSCEEGMWSVHDLSDAVMHQMELNGCELTRDQIFNTAGTGIANAVVRVGSTGSFVSPDGLILTNHHVAFSAVQRMSTPERNYITEGFLARTREEEVPAVGYNAYITLSVEDVTKKVLSAVRPSMGPLERYKAIERRIREIVRKAESTGDVYCEVNGFSGEAKYLLYTFIKMRDVRVVYVPSRAIGEYGGDIDNWMWPRHTGDFSFLRAYVAPDGKPAEFSRENVPYRPNTHLKIAPEGLKEGDFGLIIGFPGSTDRYLTSYALADLETFEYPERIRLRRQIVAVLQERSDADPTAAVRVASEIKGVNNRLKKNEGTIEGFKRFNLVQKRRDAEKELLGRLKSDVGARQKCEALLGNFKTLYEERSKYAAKDLLLEFLLERDSILSRAMLLYRWSIEREKNDLDRESRYMDRRIPDLKRELRVFQKGLDIESDRGLLKMLLSEFNGLPDAQRVGVLDDIFGAKNGPWPDTVLDAFLEELYGNTTLDREEERLRMFELGHDKLMKENDSFIALAEKLYEEDEQRIARQKSFLGAFNMLTPEWISVLARSSGSDVYADANGTMRIGYGTVKGYSPRDAVHFSPLTVLSGVIEKHTGVRPFDCPARLIELASGKDYGSYAPAGLDDVPVNLLTTHDSTNGNSGSPLLNGKGELVGCLFDGNYEAVSSDFAFEEDITRSIHVDIRYVLFVADMVDDAQNVLRELGMK